MGNNQPPGCLAAILRLFGFKLGPTLDEDGEEEAGGLEEYPYRLSDQFLSSAELSFFKVLRLVVKDQAVVCVKVNLADVFFASGSKRQSYRNKIDRKHVDFLLCRPDNLKPPLGVELDDASHARGDRIERDRFVDGVFQAAGLPLIHIRCSATYDPNDLMAKLAPFLSGRQIDSAPHSPPAQPSAPPVCRKCGVPMVQRVASKGQNAGQQFWGCKNYPKCREMRSV